MGGILCESSLGSSTTHENPAIIVGIGINCLSSPSGLPQAATHLTLGLEEKQMTADAIRKPILDSVLNEIKILQNAGPQSVCEFYEESAVLSPGTWIQWGNPERFGKVTRLGSVGELIVHLDSQESQDSGEVHLYAEDVKITAWGKKKEAPKI
jgi:biotin-(acetyl-CoA carboxylase) ligase